MTIKAAIAVLAASIVACAVSALIARKLARSNFIVDVPNARSSHRRATPRSGGIAIFAGFAFALAAFTAMLAAALIKTDYVGFLFFAALAFALGAVDDFVGMRAPVKLLGQALVAVAFVIEFGGFESIDAPIAGDVALAALSAPLTVLFIIALMNVYNFMDGANGLAASCGAFALAGLAVAAAAAANIHWATPALLLSLAATGFLRSNFPDGRLFMGDGGSQLIGFCAAALSIIVTRATNGAISAYFMPVALAPFVFDVAFTLAHRARRGQRFGVAHKEHLYQLLIRRGASHAHVTALYLSLTAVSTALAMLSPAIPPAWRFAAPLALAVAFTPGALRVFAQARREGLLPEKAAQAEA
jgi:UDP-N-acetylmuramyl pentapeptide phosphotransferase/UDP-N-acetylglucosamine-1-phosphate transferase